MGVLGPLFRDDDAGVDVTAELFVVISDNSIVIPLRFTVSSVGGGASPIEGKSNPANIEFSFVVRPPESLSKS